LNKH